VGGRQAARIPDGAPSGMPFASFFMKEGIPHRGRKGDLSADKARLRRSAWRRMDKFIAFAPSPSLAQIASGLRRRSRKHRRSGKSIREGKMPEATAGPSDTPGHASAASAGMDEPVEPLPPADRSEPAAG